MQRKKLATLGVGAAASILALAYATGSEGSTPGVDLGITGSVVAGVTASQAGQEVPFSFTITNHSTTTTASLSFNFTITHGSADVAGDFVCPLVSNHFDIFPDGSSCEPGDLVHGKSASAAVLVTPTISTGTMTVKACAQNLSGAVDPVPSNNCKTLTVTIR